MINMRLFKNDEFNESTIDIFHESFYQNFYDYYAFFLNKKSEVIFFNKSNTYAIFKYETIKEVLKNPDFSSNNYSMVDKILLGEDGEAHKKNKSLIVKNLSFLKHNINNNINSYSNQVFKALFNNAVNKKEINLVSSFIRPFVTLVYFNQSELFNFEFDLNQIQNDKLLFINDLYCNDKDTIDVFINDVFNRRLENKKLNLLINQLIERGYEQVELIKFLKTFIQAGILTTSSLISSCVLNHSKSLVNPSNEDQLTNFIDEIARLYSPSQFVYRTANKDTKIGSIKIPKGSNLAISIGAANRDSKIFKNPNEFKINRRNKHIAFGAYSHKCIGEKFAVEITKIFMQNYHLISDSFEVSANSIKYKNTPHLFTPEDIFCSFKL